jgi:FKBP-type peptidyl-prolyl cis-trans isomerase
MVVAVALLPFLSWSADKAATPPPELKTFQDKLSYVLGREVGQGLSESPSKIDVDLFMRGIQDTLNNRKSLVSPEEEEQVKNEFSSQMREAQAKKLAAVAEQNAKAEESFLSKNKSQKGVVTTASGLQYQVLKEGTGAGIKDSDRVKVHYRGSLIDGTGRRSSTSPASFRDGRRA